MIPLFKTHFSIGRSLLTPERCFELAKESNLSEIVFLEDSFSGFRKINLLATENGFRFRFGIRLLARQAPELIESKIVLFAKNNDGLRSLREIFTKMNIDGGVWDIDKSMLKDIQVVIPFYDSFVHKNLHEFGVHNIELPDLVYFVEDNGHPFDYQILRGLERFKEKKQSVKSIFYEKKENFKEYQFYRSNSQRQAGKIPVFTSPELENCGSDKFCWEDFQLRNQIVLSY